MEEENERKLFVRALVAFAGCVGRMPAGPFSRALYSSIVRLADAYDPSLPEGEKNVAQYIFHQQAIKECDRAVELLDLCQHVGALSPIPLSETRRLLLEFKVRLVSAGKRPRQTIGPGGAQSSKSPRADATQRSSKGTFRFERNDNKEKIYIYIKKFPNVRAKDLVGQFSSLSVRTVKRHLKELIADGYIQKQSNHGATFYLPAPPQQG